MNDDITIGSSNVDVSDSLRDHARQRVQGMAEKYLQHLTKAGVHFSHEGADFRCSVNVQIGGLPMMSAEAVADNAYVSCDLAAEKVAKQLRRAKRELREDKASRPDKQFPMG